MNNNTTNNDIVYPSTKSSYHLIIETFCLISFLGVMVYIYFISDASLSDILNKENFDSDFARFLALAVGNGFEFLIYCVVFSKLFTVFANHKLYIEECKCSIAYYISDTILAVAYSFIMTCSLLFAHPIAMLLSWIIGMIAYCFGKMTVIFLTLPFTILD